MADLGVHVLVGCFGLMKIVGLDKAGLEERCVSVSVGIDFRDAMGMWCGWYLKGGGDCEEIVVGCEVGMKIEFSLLKFCFFNFFAFFQNDPHPTHHNLTQTQLLFLNHTPPTSPPSPSLHHSHSDFRFAHQLPFSEPPPPFSSRHLLKSP